MARGDPRVELDSCLAKTGRLLAAGIATLVLASSPACSGPAADQEPAPPNANFDYPGGRNPDGTACVDICGITPDSPVRRPDAVVCFEPDDRQCASKTGDADYDYLLLSQHWLPTVCRGLAEGYDTTLTHRAAAVCRPGTPSRLSVHGLWPNYTAGFPQCCGRPLPLSPAAVRRWPGELRERLQESWLDPTTDGVDEATCEILNHEWQKHGTCMEEQNDAGARRYFATGLELAARLAATTATIEGWAGTTVPSARIEGLYPRSVQLLCDAAHPESLLEIHTCWDAGLDSVDCPPASGFGPLVPCGRQVALPSAS